MLTDAQRAALRSLRLLWPERRIILIGASALAAQSRLPRFTADVDVTVSLELMDYPGELVASKEWSPDPKQRQRWIFQDSVLVDIIPAGPRLLIDGYLSWPNDHRLSLEGFSALFAAPLPLVEPQLPIEVATIPLVVLLKMVAWLDRPAERARDLHDLAFLLTSYLDENVEADFDRILDAIRHGHVDLHAANAFALGHDVASVDGATAITQRFVTSLTTTHRWMLSEMQARGPATLSRDEAFDSVWRSFVIGLGVKDAE